MKIKIYISLFILCFLCACNLPTSPESPERSDLAVITLRIKGSVVDATSNDSVIANVNIQRGLMGYLAGTTTNDKGEYSIESIADWDFQGPRYFLLVSAIGYKTQMKENIEFIEEWQIIDFQLERESALIRVP